MVEFWNMTRAEGKAYLLSSWARTRQHWRDCASRQPAAAGPTTLDLSPASLAPLWEWAVPRASWRAGWVPVPRGEMPRQIYPEDLEPADQLPSWFAFPSVNACFSAETLWLLDGLGRYLGETLVATVPGAKWLAGHNRHKGYMYENHPVVRFRGDEHEPMHSAGIVLGRALAPWAAGPGSASLADVYNVWTA